MFVSSTDYNHILKDIRPDVRPILHKIHAIDSDLRKIYTSPVSIKIDRKKVSWRSPINRREWKIFCNIHKHKRALKISYQPATCIETSIGKDYLLLLIENLARLDMMEQDGAIIRIITGHFSSRFKERTESDGTGEDLIARYYHESGVALYGFVEPDKPEIRYLNKFGMALGEYHRAIKIMRLNTFISHEMLKDDQKAWAKDLIYSFTNLENVRHIYQLTFGPWKEYVNKGKLEELLKLKIRNGFNTKEVDDLLFKEVLEVERKDLFSEVLNYNINVR